MTEVDVQAAVDPPYHAPVAAPIIEVRDLVKHFVRHDGREVKAVDGVSFDVMAGEFIVLLGPSGCGKTSLLRCVGGLETPDAGEIRHNGRTLFSADGRENVAAEKRRMSMVFQSYALWPHMTVFQNVAYPLVARKVRKAEIAERVRMVLELVGVPDLANQHIDAMSGGQQQRVALARAIVANDDVILFDEPLSNVDAKVREQLRYELIEMQRKLGFAALYVTHDQSEAMQMASRIAVMAEGKIVQLGTAPDIYDRPATRYVATFVGTTNELLGEVLSLTPDASSATVRTALGDFTATASTSANVGDDVLLAFRPERCTIDPVDSRNQFSATVRTTIFAGPHAEYVLDVGDVEIKLWQAHAPLIAEGTVLRVGVEPSFVRMLAVER